MSIWDKPLSQYDAELAQTEASLDAVRTRLPLAQAHVQAEARRLAKPLARAAKEVERAGAVWARRLTRTRRPRHDGAGNELVWFERGLPASADRDFGNLVAAAEREVLTDAAAEGAYREAQRAHQALVQEQRAAEAAVVALAQRARQLEGRLATLAAERARVAAAPPPAPPVWPVPAHLVGPPYAGDLHPPAPAIVPRLAPDDPRLAWGGAGAPPVPRGVDPVPDSAPPLRTVSEQ